MMMAEDSRPFLIRYVRERSESAFRELVRQHAPLVHATALRKLNGDAAAAQDVMQEVFTLLAEKAPRLRNVVLAGWLYRQTCRRAANFVRTERRRKHREKIAMESFATSHDDAAGGQLARELDDALLALPEPERVALVLRFLEGQPFAAVGRALGVSEEAARKRVRRGLDRLEANFRRKGIVAGGAGLGSSLSGYAAPALPAAMVTKISSRALEASPAATPFAAAALLKPLAMGVLAGSLVSVPLLAVQRSSTPSATESAQAAISPSRRPQPRMRISAGETSLESIIRQLKQIEAGPSNVVTSLRRDALLEQIPFGEIPVFMALAKEMLTASEKVAIYEPLLERWAAEDPDAALTFILHAEIVGELRPASSTNVLVNLFDEWSRKDIHGAKEWLLREWGDERMESAAILTPFRFDFARTIAEALFLDHGSAALSDFIQRIPQDAGRSEALKGVVGHFPYHGQLQIRDIPKKRLEALEYIRSLPEHLRPEIMRAFVRSWAEAHPGELLEAMEKADPYTRFDLALGRLAARREPGLRTPTPGGHFETPTQVTDIEARAELTVDAGMEAGLARAEVLKAVAGVMVERVNRNRFFEWFERHQHDADFDDVIAARVRREAEGYNTSADFPGRVALEWAALISNPTLRLQLSRGIFRQLLANNWARSLPDDLDLAPEVRAELQRMWEGEL